MTTESLQPTRQVIDVHRWLVASGWKVGQTLLYNHVREGKLTRDPATGMFTPRRVAVYARTFLRKISCGKTVDEEQTAALAREKMLVDTDLKRIRREREEFRLAVEQGHYLLRDEVETMLADRAASLKADATHLAQGGAAELVALAHGDSSRTDRLAAALLRFSEDLFSRFDTSKELTVEFYNDESSPEPPNKNKRTPE